MAQLIWGNGTGIGLHFINDSEYYETLGYLCKDPATDHRLSITDYVKNLVYNHNFSQFYDPTGNRYTFYRYPKSLQDVINTVPTEYWQDFDRGYNL